MAFLAVSSKAAVDRYHLRFEFQLPHSNPILVNNMLQNDSKETSCSPNFKCFIFKKYEDKLRVISDKWPKLCLMNVETEI